MRDDALESADESFGESPAGISGVADKKNAGRDGATGTSRPVSGFAEFMRMQLAHDDAVVDETRAAGRNKRLVRSFERAYVENDARAAAALCRADCDWCDGERLVRGREKIAALLTKEWGEQSDRVQRTKVFTSGHNRVATCFEREYVARVPGTSPGTRIRERRRPTAPSDDDARRKRARGEEREPRRLQKYALRRPRRRVLGLRRRWLRARARRHHHPNAGQRYVARGCDRGIELVAEVTRQ